MCDGQLIFTCFSKTVRLYLILFSLRLPALTSEARTVLTWPTEQRIKYR